jgi:predicted ATPase
MFERATRISDGQIRFIGLISMLLGVLLLTCVALNLAQPARPMRPVQCRF